MPILPIALYTRGVVPAIDTIFRDRWLIAVNKPCGLPAQPDKSGDPSALTLVSGAVSTVVHPVHRIDRPVSGVLVFALDSRTAGAFGRLMADGNAERTYLALVTGPVEPASGVLCDGIEHDRRTNRSRIAPAGERAELEYRIIAVGDRYTLLRVNLRTGRHHQIRAQLSARGWFIRGDLKYGARRSQPGGGIGLHAYRIAFDHPWTHARIDVVAEPPDTTIWRSLCAIADGGSVGADRAGRTARRAAR